MPSKERQRLMARQALRERKSDEAYQDWLRQLRDRAYVEYRLEDKLTCNAGHRRHLRRAGRHRPGHLPAPGVAAEVAGRASLVVLGDRGLLRRSAPRSLGIDIGTACDIRHVPLRAPGASPASSTPPTPATCSTCSTPRWPAAVGGEFAAMVTAPVHKGVINDAGIPFTGHTEYLAEQTAHAARGDDAGRPATAACAWRWPPPTCR